MNRWVLAYLLLSAVFAVLLISPPGAIFVEGAGRGGALPGLILPALFAVASWEDRPR
jgi:hypothetical protein